MERLGQVVDSLNLQFNACDLDKTYKSFYQGFAHFVDKLSGSQAAEIQNGISFSEFKRKHPRKVVHEKIWMVREPSTYKDLDPFNRIRAGFLAGHFFHNLSEDDKNLMDLEEIKQVIEDWPEYMKSE